MVDTGEQLGEQLVLLSFAISLVRSSDVTARLMVTALTESDLTTCPQKHSIRYFNCHIVSKVFVCRDISFTVFVPHALHVRHNTELSWELGTQFVRLILSLVLGVQKYTAQFWIALGRSLQVVKFDF